MTFELIKKRFLGMCTNYIGGSCMFEEGVLYGNKSFKKK